MNDPDLQSRPPVDAGAIGEPAEPKRLSLVAGSAFGAMVGTALGAVVGAAFCWLTGRFDSFLHDVQIGALVGSVFGALIGFIERVARRRSTSADVATYVGVVFGLVPAALIGLPFLGPATGKVAGRFLIGAFFVGPMIGLVVGGILDRGVEAAMKRSWRLALASVVFGVASCVVLLLLIDKAAYGPDPKRVRGAVMNLLDRELSANPNRRGGAIHDATLVREGRTAYAGFADATLGGQRQRLIVKARVEGDLLTAEWTVEEQPGRDR